MASLDANLEHLIINIMGFTLTHPVGLVLPQSYVTTFDEFHTIDVDDVYKFQYSSTPKVYQIQNYTSCLSSKFNVIFIMLASRKAWMIYNPMIQTYGARLSTLHGALAPATATTLPVTSMSAAYVSPAQKDDEAALISWNRKPRDVAKYPLLKKDADYQDWKLKMKRQLIADT
jgi:hypothetical protein